jgi:hypothetical protein
VLLGMLVARTCVFFLSMVSGRHGEQAVTNGKNLTLYFLIFILR